MSTYGNNPYSTITYGPYSLVTFDATPVTATPTDHGVITVTWNKPTGSWDLLHVVRNTYGYPVTPDDGDMLLELTPTSTVYTYVDNNNGLGLTQGLTYYYTIFVRQASPQKWFSAGSAEGWSVYDYGTAAAMYDALPEIYKSPASDTYYLNTIIDPITGKPISEANDGKNIDLYNFLQVFGFEYDLFKTQATNVKDRYKVLSVNGDLIPTMLNQFGFTYEKELGLQQARKLLSNAWAIYSRRGTVAGLKNFVTAYSGYNATLLPIKNLMLSTNDSSFASSIGFWETISNATISQISGAGESPVVTPYNESTSPSDFPNISTGIMKAVATASGAMSFADGLSAPRTKGIPVTAGLAYSLSLYSIAKTTARSITLTVNWYDKYGVLLSTSAGASGNNALSNWTRVSATNQVAPANAYFAVPVVSIAGNGAGEIHYLDAVQFEQSTTITNFVDARRIDILLNANRVNWCSNPNFEASSGTTTVRTNLVTNPSFEASSGTVTVRTNLITNPSFETNTTGWNPAGAVSGSLTRVTTDAYVGTASAQMAWTGAGLGYIEQSNTASAAASAGATYTGSIYVKQTVGSARSINLNFNWWNSSNAYISTTSGTASTTVIGSWVRYSITATAPATTASVGFQVYLGTVASGDTFLIDAALTEQSSVLGTYFDGSRQPALRTNLAPNPSFETNPTGQWGQNSTSFSALSSAQFYVGTQSWLLTANGGGSFGAYLARQAVDVGGTYTFSIYIRDLNTGVQYKPGIEWYAVSSGGTPVSTSYGSVTTVTSSGWTRVSVTGTVPAGAYFATAFAYSNTAAASGTQAYFDAGLFEQSSVLGTYFDGTTTAANGSSYTWTGTANASTSIAYSSDLSIAWTGTTNASTSTLSGANLNGGDIGSYYTSTIYQVTDGVSGTKAAAVRIFNTAANPNGILAMANTASVPSGTTVTASMYVKGTAGVQVIVAGRASDTSGSYLTEGLNAQNITFTGSWQRVSVTYAYTGVAYRPGIQAVLYNTSVSGTFEFYVDAVLIEQAPALSTYFDGSFASAGDFTYSWTGTANASTSTQVAPAIANWTPVEVAALYQDTAQYYVGTKSLALQSTAAGNSVARYSGNPAVTPGGSYAVAAYVRSAAVVRTAYIQLDWYTSGNAFISSSIGTVLPTSTTAWTRVSALGTAPSNASYVQIVVKFPSTAYGEVHYVDAVLLEQASTVNPYFDGSTGYYQTADLKWENGVTNTGRSFYYKNYAPSYARLKAVTGDYLQLGSNWAYFVAQTP